MNIGENLRYLRKLNSMTLEEVGEKIDAPRQTVFKYEKGIVTNIPLNKIKSLAEIYNVTPAYIMGLENTKSIELKERELIKVKEDMSLLKKKYEFIDNLNEEEIESVKKYVEFLKSKRKNRGVK